MEEENFNQNKLFKLAGRTVRYAPLNWWILVHVITERYDNNVEHGTFAQYSMLHEDEENLRDKRWEIVQEREWRI